MGSLSPLRYVWMLRCPLRMRCAQSYARQLCHIGGHLIRMALRTLHPPTRLLHPCLRVHRVVLEIISRYLFVTHPCRGLTRSGITKYEAHGQTAKAGDSADRQFYQMSWAHCAISPIENSRRHPWVHSTPCWSSLWRAGSKR